MDNFLKLSKKKMLEVARNEINSHFLTNHKTHNAVMADGRTSAAMIGFMKCFQLATKSPVIQPLKSVKVKSSSKKQKKYWDIIKKANWKKDHDYTRISKEFRLLSKEEFEELESFIDSKMEQLNSRFEKSWLGNPGINVSDDGWSDLRAEVIGRGEKFFNSITVQKLRKMANTDDYNESFIYSLME